MMKTKVMKTWMFKLKIFILIIACRSGHAQVSNFIYALNNTSTGIFHFSKVEIATGLITNFQMVPPWSLSLSSSSTIDNYHQKYFFCTGDTLITFDAVSGTILSNIPLPIPSTAELFNIQFNPCDSAIYGILNNYPASISFVHYNIATNTIMTISSLNPNTFFCTYCGSFLDPVTGIYGFLNFAPNLNISGLDISTGQFVFNTPVNDLPGETFGNITLKCSTHEIFGTSVDYSAGVTYLSTINPNTGNVTHVSNPGWTPGLNAAAGGGSLINQLTGDYYYTAGDTLIGANTLSGNLIYNQTINSGYLFLIQHFSQCACSPNGISELKRDLTVNLTPNPSNGNFKINFNNNTSEKTIRIFDVTGNIIYEKNKLTNSEVEINLTASPKGIYFLKVMTRDKITVAKILIQ
ncbi:MAG TPA: T9SS type A sorting domain-containing protein [Bacteroidia bacterium]|nr:T9SS type A sorting domain-containing protein [Bacteroidia bacterium]